MIQRVPNLSATQKVLQTGRPVSSVSEQNAAVGTRTYNGTSKSPHSGGGIDLGGYRKRDAVAKATRSALNSQAFGSWRKSK